MIDLIEVKKFTLAIEEIVEKEELNYIEAVTYFCEQKDIDVLEVVPFIQYNHQLKNKLYDVATELNYVKKISRLPNDRI